MEFLSKLKSSLKRGFTVLCAAVMVLTSGILTGTELTASAATLHGATYLNEAINKASGGKYREPLDTWQSFLDAQSKTDYYKGTPYSSWLYAASPKGDLWQRNEGYSSKIGAAGGMNCTGFVWHIISNGLAQGSGQSIATTGTWVPNSNGFNSKGFSRSCWTNGSWYKFITQYNVHYYEFATKSEMLSSGVLQKGDIIWCVNASQGNGLAGLSNPDSYHHIGIYMGNGKSDSWWQSGPVNGDGNMTGEINSINQIYGKATKNTYVVIPWAEGAKPTFDPTFLAIAKVDSETGKATAQGAASLEGAEFTLKYYSGTSATGTPAKTWILSTDSNGRAYLKSSYLKSGTLFTDGDGDAYLPLGTVTIQETKAPTGYKINNTIKTIHIVEKDGKAVIQEEGATTYLQKYTDTVSEDIVRGNLELEKQNGETGEEFSFIPFILTNNNTLERHLLLTDKNGVIDTSLNRDKANILDDYLSNLKFDNTSNELTFDTDTMEKMVSATTWQAAGVWFGDGSISTTTGALPYGSYTLNEVRCQKNAGYHLITRTFQVTASQTSVDLGTLIDTTAVGTIRGKKVDPDGNGLSGAVIGLFAKDTTEFTVENTYTGMTATSGDDGSFTFENVPKGEYIVREIAPPEGYLLSEKSYPVTVKVSADGEEVLLDEDIVNTPVTVELSKVDGDGKPLSGAKLQIIGPNSTPIEDWTSDGTVHTVTGKLAVGKTYIYNEYVAPDGYVKGDLIYFTIQADGSVTDLDGNPIDLEMVNTATVVEISKLDENENHLAGAVMQIKDKDGKVVDEWTTDGKVHTLIGKLKAGATYTLHEVSAPNGYYLEDDVTFTVGADGTASVGMTDLATYVGIRKRDDQGNLVVGSVLQILDENHNVVEEWTTTEDEFVHKVETLLNPGVTYTLHEVSAPKGYFLADDITFQVAEKGQLSPAITMIDIRQGSLLVGKLSDIQQQPESGEIIWLPGAVMQIKDKDGNVVDEWTTDNKQHTISAILTPGESYVLHEVSAPDGYCVSEDIPFTLNEKGQIVKSDAYESGGIWIRMTDLATKIEIQKTDENNKPLSGAALQILDKDGNVVDSWTTDGSVHQIYGKLIAGETYTLREVSAPAGYVKAADQQFTVGTDGKVQNITLKNIATKVGIDKVDEDSNPLKDAALQVIDASGTLIEEWTSDGTTHRIDAKLIAGAEYTLHEVSAPNGYVVASDQKFTVKADGSLTSVKMVNVSTKVQISKTAITGDTELAGAKLEVRDQSGNVLDSWTSGSEAHMITAKLTAGQTYVLHETAAPNGYVVANDIEFTVNKDGTVTKVTMKDDTTKVEINKVTEGSKPLSGAKLQIKDKNGKVVDEWTSDGKAHTLTAKLTAGASYTLHEVSAPTGYCVAADQTFVVDATGKLTTVNMTDLTTKVSITKYEITGQKELPGAKPELYATEKDKDGNAVKKGNAIDAWTSEATAHEIVGKLTAGATYIVHETAAPNGYVVASDVTFTVNADGTVTKVTMKDDTTKVEINKVTEGSKPLSGAKLQIKDKDGKVVDEWTSDGKAHTLTAKLTAGAAYTLHEVSAPAGYCTAPDQTFTVPTNGNKLTVSMTDLATDVKVQKLDADDKPLSGAKLQIISTDDAGKETVVDEWTTDGKTHEIKAKLIAGKTYTLRETASPSGYYKAKDITFTVNADGTPNEVSLYNAKTKVSISKYDITGEKEIAGAQLEVRDMDGNVLDSWTSETKAHLIEGVLVAGQTYVLHEAIPADGYVVASDVEFTVTPDGNVTEVKMYDDTTKVEINKLTEEKKPLSGAVMQIVNKTGEVIDEWTTDGTAHVLTAKLTAGVTYTLHEVSAPAGYVVSPDQQFTVNTDGSVTSVSMIDLATVVRIDKVDPDGNPLKGAKLQILDENEKVLDEWTSDGTVHEIKAKLTAGKTYTLRETASPAGYYVSKDSTFTVNLDGTPNEITLYNVKTKVAITKYDITGENPLPGALLQVKDTKGNVLDEWTSGTDAHIIEGVLVSGGTYVLHEETAPDGYVLASDMQFTVNPDGTITTVSMKDDTTKVSITKKDITGENEIAGAALEVRDADGNVIDSWISDGTPHVISGILVAGATYTLHEVSAPDGYVVAKDAEFTVDAEGNVTSVTMLDDTTKVSITKYDLTGENEIAGASLEVRDAEDNIIDAWVSDGTAHQIIGVLAVGQTYTLHEVAAPNGFVVANDVEFQVNADGSVTIVNMYDDTTKVHITKYEITGQHELPGASLELKDSDGNVIDAWISGSKAHEIIGVLTAGAEYTLHEVAAPQWLCCRK